MNKMSKISIFLIIIFYTNILLSWEVYDQVIAVVNNVPIIESEVIEKFNHVQRLKKIPKRKINYEKSRVLDKFIEDSLVLETANEESIIISDIRILEHIEKIMREYFASRVPKKKFAKVVSDVKKRLHDYVKGQKLDPKKETDKLLIRFEKFINSKQKVKLKFFFAELRKQMRKEQVMNIAIGVSPPAKEEAKKWYKKNKYKLGYEMRVKHILIKLRKKSIKEERRVNKLISDLRTRALRGESFEKLAKKHSQDPASAKKGGDMGWVLLQELDPFFAGNIYKMKTRGEISKVFKSSYGYHVVKLIGKRAVSFEKAERMIMHILYQKNLQDQFLKWVKLRKEESEIRIYMKNYIKI